jgi:hypothetical protein
MFEFLNKKKKSEEDVTGSTLYDLTHLEINTIIKDDMTASKASSSARLLLHNIAGTYDSKLISLGEKYAKLLSPEIVEITRNSHTIPPERVKDPENTGQSEPTYEILFRGLRVYEGSGFHSFRELSFRAEKAFDLLKEQKSNISGLPDGEVGSDMMMLKRIQSISDNIRSILVISGEVPKDGETEKFDFDDVSKVREFMYMKADKAQKLEPKIDLRQLMVIKKANDIGTEQVVMQTIIGMDGDITTRISRSFANQPIPFVNDIHKDTMMISVDYWKFLITVVVDLGKSIARFLSKL